MAKIVHRPKPEIVVPPDYNKVLQNVKPAQQASMQARAELEQARSRFEQSLQKATSKSDHSSVARKSDTITQQYSDKEVTVASRPLAGKSAASETRGSLSGTENKNPQRPVTAQSLQQQQASSGVHSTNKSADVPLTNRRHDANAERAQEQSTQRASSSSFKLNSMFKASKSEEDDGVTDLSLESMAFGSPLATQEPQPLAAEVLPMASTGTCSQFETIESMLNHLSLMTARYGSRDWVFEIQNENSALLSVSLMPATDGGWNVAITANSDDHSEAQRCLDELEAMLQDTHIVSLNIKEQTVDHKPDDDRDEA